MARATIRETIVTPDEDGLAVRLVLADVPPPYENAAMHLQLLVRLPAYEPPLFAQLQSEAIEAAMRELEAQLRDLYAEIRRNPNVGANARPDPRQS